MGNNSHVINFSEKGQFSKKLHGGNYSSPQLPVVVEEAMSIYLQQLNDRLSDVLSDVDDHLFDKSGKSQDGEHFVAMRTLRLQKDKILSLFKQQTVQNFKQSLGKSANISEQQSEDDDEFSVDGLSLVDEKDLEERIALDSMTGKAQKKNLIALEHLRQRLDVLMPEKAITKELNSFAPSYVCSAFFEVLQNIDLTLEFKLVLYKYLDRKVIENLDVIYEKANQFFIDRGILPELKAPPVQKTQSSSRKDSADTQMENQQLVQAQATNPQINQPQQTHQAQEKNHSQSEEILGLIGELLSERRNYAANAAPRVEQQINTGELVNLLSNIQVQQPVNQQVAMNLADIRSMISSQLPAQVGAQVNNGALGQFSDDMIDIVTMLFDFILDDENLHSEIKAIIARLQIPILKVGLVDKSFLSNRKHPARLLLNELARAGLSWDSEDSGAGSLLEKIKSVSEVIFNDFKDDVTLFDNLLSDFIAFKNDYQKRATIFEKRTKEAEEGKAKAETARAKVNEALKAICRRKHIPEVVKQLLKNVWVHVMFLERLKADEQGWEAVKKVAQILVWSVQPINEQERLDKLTKIIPALIKNLKLGFNKVAFSHIETSSFLDRLEDEHRQIISQARENIQLASKDEILRLKPLTAEEQNEQQAVNELQKNDEQVVEEIKIEEIAFSAQQTGQLRPAREIAVDLLEENRQLVANLHAGSWFELKFDENFKRCKLAARILSSDKFIFVNSSGVKVAEFLSEELAAEYQLGHLKLLDDEALFDRALESVISNLRSMKAEA